jgi:acetyl coenzyme A synthetase (ADP forming)-like protein
MNAQAQELTPPQADSALGPGCLPTGCEVVLRDGSTVHIRPAAHDEDQNLIDFYRSLAAESRRLRFFTGAIDLVAEARRELVDDDAHVALMATSGPADRIVAHAMYVGSAPGSAEVALAVADDWQGRGLGTLLLGHLAVVAAARGIDRFETIVLPENLRMLETFRQSGFETETCIREGDVCVTLSTALSPTVQHEFDRREQVSAASAVARFLQPTSIAVIGASRQRGTVGGEVFHNLLTGDFNGPVYPVNARASVVQGVLAYREIAAISGEIDLAIIAVPADHVLEVARQCALKGVRALIVLTAGFGEMGQGGRERQLALLKLCRRFGMRLVGPNCFGVLNTDPAVRMNATFGPDAALSGPLALASQSGALGIAAISEASRRGLGISSFVSMGNKADVSGNDLLCYWEQDPRTSVILLYLESFGNPRKFGRIAPRVSRVKPIVAVKSGRSASGIRAAASHTGALLGASDAIVDALFEQSGVIRTDTISQLFDVGMLLAEQPIPAGRRVAIVTNVGGPAILCADACEAGALMLPVLTQETQERLRAILPREAAIGNPVDMLAAATAEQYQAAISIVASDPNVDSIITLFLRPLSTTDDDVARAIVAANREMPAGKPLLAIMMGTSTSSIALRDADRAVPAFTYPESAANALAHAARYGEWRARDHQAPMRPSGIRRDDAKSIISTALEHRRDWLELDEVARVLDSYGIPMSPQRMVPDGDAAADAIAELKGPVALKAVVRGVTHKTDLGAVRLNLKGASSVHKAAHQMTTHLASLGHGVSGFLVQQMASPGVEMLVGVAHDPLFGPVIVCSPGGVLVELLKDVSVRLAPLSLLDAREMVSSLRSLPLLTGYRGSPPRDVAALEDILLRVSSLAEDFPEIAELDCNPVIVLEEGAIVVDARIRVAPTQPERPPGAR